jgi:hypothetical protein
VGERVCSRCGNPLGVYNPSHICWVCQEKMATRRWEAIEGPYVYVEDIAEVLEISEEQVRRLHRNGSLPSPLGPAKKLKWDKEYFLSWIHSQHKVPPVLGRQLEAFIKAHGGLHLNETTSEYELGQREDFQIQVCSKGKDGKVVLESIVVSGIIPGHYDT